MTDQRLSHLFAEGTAPDRDAAFARRVDAAIGPARARAASLAPLLALALRAALVLTVAAAIHVTGQEVTPLLAPVASLSPHFMGVPIPALLGVLLVAMVPRARRLLA